MLLRHHKQRIPLSAHQMFALWRGEGAWNETHCGSNRRRWTYARRATRHRLQKKWEKWEPFFGPGAKDFGIGILAIVAVPFIAVWWITRWVLLPVACVAIVGGGAWYLLSTVNFDAPLTLGGAIVIGMTIILVVKSSRRT